VAEGDTAAIDANVRSILAQIWACEDWDNVIRDPKLLDGDDAAWKRWLARLEQ
jgi:hypothetical protein